MNTQFRTLFTVGVKHGYYNNICEDLRFIVPGDTARCLRNGKLLTRTLDGKLHVLFEADGDGAALAAIPGKVLRFGLLATNSGFFNFTQLTAGFPDTKQLHRNSGSPTALDAPTGVTPVVRMLTHVLTAPVRPVTVTLRDGSANPLQSTVITAAENRVSIAFDLTGYPPGAYDVEEVSANGTNQTAYYSEPELVQAGVFGILEVRVSSGFYQEPPDFKIVFTPRHETLNYYIVATAEQASDLDTLSITDAGAGEDNRDPVLFTRIPAASFTGAEISPALLGGSSKQVVLFRSQAAVPRTEKARRRIQLMKNADILIPHLPQPGPGRSNADIIISVSKP